MACLALSSSNRGTVGKDQKYDTWLAHVHPTRISTGLGACDVRNRETTMAKTNATSHQRAALAALTRGASRVQFFAQ